MKLLTISILLLFLLLSSLFIGTVIGNRYQEGISLNKLTILKDIISNTDSSNIDANMTVIQTMNIEDPDFANIINSSLPNEQKVTTLKLMIKTLSEHSLDNKSYSDALSERINLPK